MSLTSLNGLYISNEINRFFPMNGKVTVNATLVLIDNSHTRFIFHQLLGDGSKNLDCLTNEKNVFLNDKRSSFLVHLLLKLVVELDHRSLVVKRDIQKKLIEVIQVCQAFSDNIIRVITITNFSLELRLFTIPSMSTKSSSQIFYIGNLKKLLC